MDAWATVASYGGEKSEADAVLIHDRTASRGQLGLDLAEIAPAKRPRHLASLTERKSRET